MGRKSTISRLPPEIRAELDTLIREGRMTIDEMLDELRELGPEGEEISRSALGRYRKRMSELGARMREAKEVAGVWVQKLGDDPESDIGQLVAQLLSTVAMQVSMDAAEADDYDPRDLHFLARAVRDIEGARKTWVDREQKVRELLKARAAEVVKKAGTSEGLTQETIERIERELKLL